MSSIIRSEVLAELDRLLASDQFAHAPQLGKFLRLVVCETLEGRADSLKEYRIGVDVFDRPMDFDPKVDPTVRVRARHVRAKLAEYYQNLETEPALRIDLPKGAYAATFVSRPPPPDSSRAGITMRGWVWMAVLVGVPLTVALASRFWIEVGASAKSAPDIRQITFDSATNTDPALSPDGRWLAYSSNRLNESRDIWVEDLFNRGMPLQLTDHPAHEGSPDISPDGSQVVYRSFRDGGGIYLRSMAGRGERRLVSGGFSPRFSPDGSRIVVGVVERGEGTVQVVDVGTGATTRVGSWLRNTSCPVWLPDGRNVVYRGHHLESGRHDWWVSPTDFDGPAERWPASPAGASSMMSDGIALFEPEATCPKQVVGDQIIFIFHERSQLWRIGFKAGKVRGKPERLAQGPGITEACARMTSANRLEVVFAMLNAQCHLWQLPIDGKTGLAAGALSQVSRDLSIRCSIDGTRSSLSPSGRWLYFDSDRAGHSDIVQVDLESGQERAVAATASIERHALAGIGQEFGFERLVGGVREYYWKAASASERRICRGCGDPLSVSTGGDRLLFRSHGRLFVLDRTTGNKREVPVAAETVGYATLSPDGKWAAAGLRLGAKRNMQGVIIPADGQPVQPVYVSEEPYHLGLHWSMNGNGLYFLSLRDDFRCLYLQRLDPASKQPVGAPVDIHHFHKGHHYPWNSAWLAIGPDRIVMNLIHNLGNLWRLEVDSL